MLDNTNAPLDKIVNTILNSAVDNGVEEIHIQRQMLDASRQVEMQTRPVPVYYEADTGVFVLFRIAGHLEQHLKLPQFVMKPLLARIQEVSDARMSPRDGISEGRLQFKHGAKQFNWQVRVTPDTLGEHLVLKQVLT